MHSLWTALSFLTILPVSKPEIRSPQDLGKAAVWFPLAGAVIGALLMAVNWLLQGHTTDGVRSVLLLVVWVVLSGGLHLDGLADCLDGLLASVSPERRLEILRDSRTGAYAVMGVSLYLLLKASALEALLIPGVLLLAPVAGRSAMLLGVAFHSARAGGLGDMFRSGLNLRRVAAAALLPLLLSVLLGPRGVLALALALITAGLVFLFAKARIGGVTGDVFGAACEVAELVVLIVFVIG